MDFFGTACYSRKMNRRTHNIGYHFRKLLGLFFTGCFLLSAGGCLEFGTRFIFEPSKDLIYTPVQAGLSYEDIWFHARDGVLLHAWMIPGRAELPLVLFFHGNASNITHVVDYLAFMNGMGFPIFIFDYRGFGKSLGVPLYEEDLYNDARGALSYLQTRKIFPPEIIYLGRSLGSAAALQMALESPPLAVVLECPFTTLADMAWHLTPVTYLLVGWWSIGGRFNNLSKIAANRRPVLIFQGDRDRVVPDDMARALYERAGGPKTFHLVAGAGHNDIFQKDQEAYRNAWMHFFKDLSFSKPGSAAPPYQRIGPP